VFWLNIPVAVVIVWLVVTSVDESRDETGPRAIDLPGLVLVIAGVAAISFAFDKADRWGWVSAATIGLVATGLLLLLAFVLVESKV
jgi:hypothetical protein